MSDFEFIDLFPRSGGKDTQQSYEEEEYDYSNGFESTYIPHDFDEQNVERIRINDYKHSPNSIRRGNSVNPEETLRKTVQTQTSGNASKSKKGSNGITDDKIVWAGALFVFFGVFVFLIGYWLGKSNENTGSATSTQRSVAEQALEEAELDTVFATGVDDYVDITDDWVLGGSDELEDAPEPETVTPIVAPPVVPKTTTDSSDTTTASTASTTTTSTKSTSTTAETTTASTSTKTTATTAEADDDDTVTASSTTTEASETGNYTIQVSAHTSMDSARLIEEELRDDGYQSYIVESIVNGTRYFRVRVGSFTVMREAKSAIADLQDTEIGADAYIINLD